MRLRVRSTAPPACSRCTSSPHPNACEPCARSAPASLPVCLSSLHSSFPQAPGERETWLRRYTAFATAKGAEPAQAEQAAKAVGANLDLLDPEADADLLRQAGFRDVELFYAAFTWRGWVGLA